MIDIANLVTGQPNHETNIADLQDLQEQISYNLTRLINHKDTGSINWKEILK